MCICAIITTGEDCIGLYIGYGPELQTKETPRNTDLYRHQLANNFDLWLLPRLQLDLCKVD